MQRLIERKKTQQRRLRERRRKVLMVLLGALAVLLVAALGFYGFRLRKAREDTPKTDGLVMAPAQNQRPEAPFGHWMLAAGMAGANLYYHGVTDMICFLPESYDEAKAKQCTVYLSVQTTSGRVWLGLQPLTEERRGSGTIDLQAEPIGFAAFLELSEEEVPQTLRQVSLDELAALVSALGQVQLIEH